MSVDDKRLASGRCAVALWLAAPCVNADEEARDFVVDRTFSSEERQRFSRFVRSTDRELFFTTRLLARVALARTTSTSPCAWLVRPDLDGRPTAQGPKGVPVPALSLSHTPGLVACAVRAGGLVGVDLEHLDRTFDPLTLARRHLASGELEDLVARKDDARAERFLEYWTLKEAYLKARGIGLRAPMRDVAIDLTHEEIVLRLGPSLADDRGSWTMRSLHPTPRHVGAIAVETGRQATLAIDEHRVLARDLVADVLRA